MRKSLIILACICSGLVVKAQNENAMHLSGSIQSDVLIPQKDAKIGSEETSHWGLTNTYADVQLTSRYLDAGLRMEFLRFPLPGYEKDFSGWGLANVFARLHSDKIEVTLGNFYEQFGSGFVLRTYEERTLGIDNSLLGARVAAKPFKGVTVKALTGLQKRYWSYNKSLVSGGDIELGLDQWFKGLENSGTYITLGASFVNKHERTEDIMSDATHKLNLPENVDAWDARLRFQRKAFNLLAEYAQKTEDPSFDNGYIYRKGSVAMLSTSYSQRGMSLLLQAKRSDNMSFRSRRSMLGTSSFINHLPAFTLDHTYALAALYPYATRPSGEWAYQAELGYMFKKNTFLGGKYGTKVKVNFSHVHGINRTEVGGMGTDGYVSDFWKWGDGTYYQDINVQLEKKFTNKFQLNLMYMNQFYNKTIVEGEGGMIHSDIFIADAKYKFSRKVSLRAEAQYLATKQDEGSWMFGLLELSIVPNWMITVCDMYNSGESKIHYYQGLLTFNAKAHRIQLGYGRTRAGYNCSGGVCRYIPASKGFTMSYNYNF